MKKILAACLTVSMLSGCASISTTVTGPGGYSMTQKGTAVGRAGIEKMETDLEGAMSFDNGKPTELMIGSTTKGEGVQSDDPILSAISNLAEAWKFYNKN